MIGTDNTILFQIFCSLVPQVIPADVENPFLGTKEINRMFMN